MERKCVLLNLCGWLVLLTSTADSQNCPSGYRFTKQPPVKLNCDPVGTELQLHCTSSPETNKLTWYWTQNACEAGVNGKAIISGDNDNFLIISLPFATYDSTLHFLTVNESTFGYYWCEISNAVNVSLRPSTITPVLQPTNMSQVPCTNAYVGSIHNTNEECAEENSPTVISRPPLSSSCVPPQLSSSVSTTPTISIDLYKSTSIVTVSVPPTTSSPASSTVTIVVIAVVVFTTLTALGLVLVLVIIWSIRRSKSSARSTTDALKSPIMDGYYVEMSKNKEYTALTWAQDMPLRSENDYEKVDL